MAPGGQSSFVLAPKGHPGDLWHWPLGLLCFNGTEQTHSVLACVSRETSFRRERCRLGGKGREEDPEIARFDCTAHCSTLRSRIRFPNSQKTGESSGGGRGEQEGN